MSSSSSAGRTLLANLRFTKNVMLGLSVKTVSTYRSRVLEKLGMRTNAELMRYAIENRLLDS